jgi:hypothetical protein
MFSYRLFSSDGDDFGEATYAQMICPSHEIIAGNSRTAPRTEPLLEEWAFGLTTLGGLEPYGLDL